MEEEDRLLELYSNGKEGNWKPVEQAMSNDYRFGGKIARYVRKTSGWTFLHQAAFWNDAHACKLFIRFGASTKKLSNDGETPIDVAQKAGYSNVVELLVNAANSSCWTPVEDSTLMASSCTWSEGKKTVATCDFQVGYGGGAGVEVKKGSNIWLDSYGRVLVGWHGTHSPPCGMDREPMV